LPSCELCPFHYPTEGLKDGLNYYHQLMANASNEMRSLKLALLINDTPVQPVLDEFGDYARIYEHWLRESKPVNDVTFHLDAFYVFNETVEYPDAGEYHAIILTGSGELLVV
jgi:hypothetical protein